MHKMQGQKPETQMINQAGDNIGSLNHQNDDTIPEDFNQEE